MPRSVTFKTVLDCTVLTPLRLVTTLANRSPGFGFRFGFRWFIFMERSCRLGITKDSLIEDEVEIEAGPVLKLQAAVPPV